MFSHVSLCQERQWKLHGGVDEWLNQTSSSNVVSRQFQISSCSANHFSLNWLLRLKYPWWPPFWCIFCHFVLFCHVVLHKTTGWWQLSTGKQQHSLQLILNVHSVEMIKVWVKAKASIWSTGWVVVHIGGQMVWSTWIAIGVFPVPRQWQCTCSRTGLF